MDGFVTKRAEFRESEAKLQVVAECMSEGLIIFDENGTVLFHNPESSRILGFPPEQDGFYRSDELSVEWQGWDEDGVLLPFDRWPIGRVLKGERIHNQFLHAERTDKGVIFDARYNGSPIYGESGEFLLGFITMRDVGEEVRSQRELASAHDLLRGVTDTIPGLLFAKDREGRMILVNQLAEEAIGKTRSELIGRTDAEIVDDAVQAEAFMANDRRIMNAGIAEQVEETLTLPNGTVATWLSTKAPVRNADGAVTGLVGMAVDITARKAADAELLTLNDRLVRQSAQLTDANEQLKEALAQSVRAADELRLVTHELLHMSRRAAMGDMAATIAHEINQPLGAISNYLSGSLRLLKNEGFEGPALQAIGRANDQCLRMSEIIQRVRSFVSGGDSDRRAESISVLVDEACELALLGARNNSITVLVEHADADMVVLVSRVEIQQVIVNLVRNAMEAMNGAKAATLQLTTSHGPGTILMVSISDNGPGISSAVCERLFEPFVTTKGIHGMGIGLSVSRTIIEDHGGKIWADNNAERGATFRFTLPQVNEEVME